MTDAKIFHNPRCSKSREALNLLEDRDLNLEIVKYLDEPPTREELVELISILEDPPSELVRRDPRFKELGIDPASLDDVDVVVDLLVAEPSLMQRPVVVSNGRAIIARPTPDLPIQQHLVDLLGSM